MKLTFRALASESFDGGNLIVITLFDGKFSKCEITLIRLSSFIMSFLASSIYTVPILFPGPRDPECNINHKRSSSSRQAYKVVEIIKGVSGHLSGMPVEFKML